jgi:hypothetical protein
MRLSDFLKRHLGKAIFLFVAGYSLVYATAFIQLYFMEHPYRIVSAWIYENVPAGSKIASPHWDDKVPVTLPGPGRSAPQVYKMEGREFELSVYEQDTPQNIQTLLRRMAASDYISFATPRTPDSIPRVEKEYPHTTAIIQLLWAEKLGFSLAKTVKNRPSFLGITFNDDLADESFSVYDHPKAVVFKNDEHLSAEELWSRMTRVEEYRPLPTMNEILLMDQGGWKPPHQVWKPQYSVFARTAICMGVLGLSVWALVVTPNMPLALMGFAVGAAAVLGAAISIAANAMGLLPFTGVAGRFVVFGILVLAMARIALVADVRQRFWNSLKQDGHWLLLTIIAVLCIARFTASPNSVIPMVGGADSANYLAFLVRAESFAPNAVSHEGTVPSLVAVVAWVLKIAGVPFSMLFDATTLVVGFVQGCFLYATCVLVIRRRAAATIAATLAAVPTAYLLLGTTAGAHTNQAERAQLAPERTRFVQWSVSHIKGAPPVVEACEDTSVGGIVALAGLSVASDVTAVGGGRLCEVVDATVAFETMMKRGLEFFLTPNLGKASSAQSAARLADFGARRDLFSKLYEDESFVVFVPAFSRYFRPEERAS